MVHCCGFTTSVSPNATSVFTSQTPVAPAATDANGAVTLGMRFQSTISGYIDGAKFYKVAGMGGNGTHIGVLYNNTGTRSRNGGLYQ